LEKREQIAFQIADENEQIPRQIIERLVDEPWVLVTVSLSFLTDFRSFFSDLGTAFVTDFDMMRKAKSAAVIRRAAARIRKTETRKRRKDGSN
jgi:hypothetical protein